MNKLMRRKSKNKTGKNKKERTFSKILISLILIIALAVITAGCGNPGGQDTRNGIDLNSGDNNEQHSEENKESGSKPNEDGTYYSKEDVALYLYTYKKLPSNYITKTEAKKLGWEGGSVEKFAKGKAIGGDKFGNYEELLPKDAKYFECDIDTNGQDSRGAKRIIFSSDCEYVYYTEDHYKTFELIEKTE